MNCEKNQAGNCNEEGTHFTNGLQALISSSPLSVPWHVLCPKSAAGSSVRADIIEAEKSSQTAIFFSSLPARARLLQPPVRLARSVQAALRWSKSGFADCPSRLGARGR